MKKYYYGIGLLFMALLLFSSCEKGSENKIPYVDEGDNTRKHIASLYHALVDEIGGDNCVEARYIFHWDKDLLRTVDINSWAISRPCLEFEYDNTGKIISAKTVSFNPQTRQTTVGPEFDFVYTDTFLTEIYCRDPYNDNANHGYTNANQFLLYKFYYNNDGLLSKIESHPHYYSWTIGDVISTAYLTWEKGNIIRIDENEEYIEEYNYDEGVVRWFTRASRTSEFEYDNRNSNKENLMPFFFCIYYLSFDMGPSSGYPISNYSNILDRRYNMIASLLSKNQIINSRTEYHANGNEENWPIDWECSEYVYSTPREITYDGGYMVYYSISNCSSESECHHSDPDENSHHTYNQQFRSAIYYTDGSGYWWGPDRF